MTRRAFERRRRECERALALAERRLAAAQEKLGRLGRLGRWRQRAELQAEVSLQRATLHLVAMQKVVRASPIIRS